MIQFNLPTLVSITAPTCAGKNFLLEALVQNLGFNRIVSTTDRPPRAGEIEGTHYNFISTEKSKLLEAQGDLAELVTYNGVRYGVTHREMEIKMQYGAPPIVILEPQGVEIYRKYCASKKWQLFTIYVMTQESVRIERLTARTAQDVFESKLDLSTITKIIDRNNKRLQAVLDNERNWAATNRWDLYVSGINLERDLRDVQFAVEGRNKRSELYA